jgi:very-short-patch-repair endonuclease
MSQPRRLTPTAKALRHDSTKAESILWRELRAHRFQGYKFKRQEPIGAYVVDFICYESKLVIELDGGHHADQQEADAARTTWLEAQGSQVVRFWNNEVLQNTGSVLQRIEEYLGTV